MDAAERLVGALKQRARARFDAALGAAQRTRLIAGSAVLGGVLPSVLMHRGFVRSLLMSLKGAVRNCELIAAGDLRVGLPSAPGDNEVERHVAVLRPCSATCRPRAGGQGRGR